VVALSALYLRHICSIPFPPIYHDHLVPLKGFYFCNTNISAILPPTTFYQLTPSPSDRPLTIIPSSRGAILVNMSPTISTGSPADRRGSSSNSFSSRDNPTGSDELSPVSRRPSLSDALAEQVRSVPFPPLKCFRRYQSSHFPSFLPPPLLSPIFFMVACFGV
jgi:hypothetical protein